MEWSFDLQILKCSHYWFFWGSPYHVIVWVIHLEMWTYWKNHLMDVILKNQLSYCKVPILMWQYSCFPCLWALCLALDSISCACSKCQEKALLLSNKLLQQRYNQSRLKLSPLKCYGHHHELVVSYGINVSKLVMDLLPVIQILVDLFPDWR